MLRDGLVGIQNYKPSMRVVWLQGTSLEDGEGKHVAAPSVAGHPIAVYKQDMFGSALFHKPLLGYDSP